MRRFLPVVLVVLLSCGPMFYRAPPPIGEYPDRIATKPWTSLFDEVAPLDPEVPTAEKLGEGARALGHLLPWMEAEERLPVIDRMLVANRNGAYSAERANWLHELRELAENPIALGEAESYLEWRLQRELPVPPVPDWNMPMQQRLEILEQRKELLAKRIETRLEELERGIRTAAEALRPHWRAQRGAYLFQLSRFDEAATELEALIAESPNHPRAEAAGVLLGRCHLEISRRLRAMTKPREAPPHAEINAQLERCERVMRDFLAKYPAGRFAADAHGWLGAVAFERGELGLAVKHQLDRLEHQPTREVTRTVLRECDFIFSRLITRISDESGDGFLHPVKTFDAVAVARHPVVARLFAQHALDPSAHSAPQLWSDFSGDRKTIEFLKRRILRPQPFVRQAMVALGRELMKQPGGAEDPATLLLLAWSATESGEHAQAWGLLEQVEAEANDEILHARAMVLQRLERHEEAVAGFDRLQQQFPKSPLVADVASRRAHSLMKSGRTGEAVLALLSYLKEEFPEQAWGNVERRPQGLQPQSQVVQWLDGLMQFSPLEQLVAVRAGLQEGDARSRQLDEVIRLRALAVRDFALAKRHLATGARNVGPVIEEDVEPQDPRYSIEVARQQGAQVWQSRLVALEDLYSELAQTQEPQEQARLHLALARHWMSHRGFITLPLLGVGSYAESEWEKQDLLRRTNALHLGFSREVVNAELDRRDEATHALEHATAASASAVPAVAAAALELANECLFRRAEFSLYQRSRAIETEAAIVSRGLFRQLQERFPESAEAKRAVYHQFLPHVGEWMPGDYNPANSHAGMLETLWPDGLDRETREEVRRAVLELPARVATPEPELTIDALRDRIDEVRKEMLELRVNTDPTYQAEVIAAIDRLDDMAAAAAMPDIAVEDFVKYVDGETESLPAAFASLVEFRNRLKAVGPADPTADAPEVWKEFLETYPDSPKAEAASLRMTRGLARQFRARVQIGAYFFPAAPITGGYKRVDVQRDREADDGAAVAMAAVVAHEDRFPGGRYQDDLDLLKAGVLIDLGRYSEALVLVQRILSTPWQRDLHGVAVLNFAEIAQELASVEKRGDVLGAFRQNPDAVKTLRVLANGDTFLSRLLPLLPWLEESVAQGN